jgi:hypothetical protein
VHEEELHEAQPQSLTSLHLRDLRRIHARRCAAKHLIAGAKHGNRPPSDRTFGCKAENSSIIAKNFCRIWQSDLAFPKQYGKTLENSGLSDSFGLTSTSRCFAAGG